MMNMAPSSTFSKKERKKADDTEKAEATIEFEKEILQSKSLVIAGLVSLYRSANPSLRPEIQARARALVAVIKASEMPAFVSEDIDPLISKLRSREPDVAAVLSRLAANQRQLQEQVTSLRASSNEGKSGIVPNLLIVPTCHGCNGHNYAPNIPCLALSAGNLTSFKRLTLTGDREMGNAFCCKPQHYRTATASECLLWATAECVMPSQ